MGKQISTVSAVASFLRPYLPSELQKSLDCYQLDSDYTALPVIESEDMRYLYGLVSRIVHRGTGTLPSIEVERYIASNFGNDVGLREKTDTPEGPVEWHFEPELSLKIEQFADFLSPWAGEVDRIPLDPTTPQNERRLLRQLLDRFGPKFMSCLYTQVHLSDILPAPQRDQFTAQRLDFLVAFPNGRCFVLEPGDHEDGPHPVTQGHLDRERNLALRGIGIPTLRPPNDRIGTQQLIEEIEGLVHKCDGEQFLKGVNEQQSAENLRLAYLILLPTLIARLEDIFTTIFLQRGLLGKESFSLCVFEQDLECAEIAFYGFMERLHRLANLNRIDLPEPEIKLTVVRTGKYACSDWSGVRKQLEGFGCIVEEHDEPPASTFDLSIDVAIKANYLTLASPVASRSQAVIRNVYPHSKKYFFSYSSHPRDLLLEGEKDQALVETFLVDFFRKKRFREGQFPIVQSILAQRATIGLLPTSAGKSICYQLSSLLTPGITLVVDPLNFLMNDQALGLTEGYGITAVDVWHSGRGPFRAEQVGEMMGTKLMIFLSPERFLRNTFRDAMRQLTAADLFINYAVIDEAHCVSMWGHDFRPPYLMLRRLFRDYCTFNRREPVVVALTGTASQLVLIDLKRQLDIEEMDSIIRPTSFERPELIYNIVSCRTEEKNQTLSTVLRSIESRLGIQNIQYEAHGIIFANLPKEVWELYGAQAGDADRHVAEIASDTWKPQELAAGMACSGKPGTSPVNANAWQLYKDKILAQFKHGRVRMLIGNTAIGVGIDCEHVNYSVVSRMPGSLESLVQQWGRAGRRGQTSQCYLVYSDDNRGATDRWLDGELENMPRRYDDLGTIAYFHGRQFPGEEVEQRGARGVVRDLLRNNTPDDDGRRIIPEDGSEQIPRYLSFFIMLGVVEDYEVTGAYQNTQYRVALTKDFEEAHGREDQEARDDIYVKSLQSYLSRYRPTTEQDVRERVQQRPENKFGNKCLAYLIGFIYSEIGYQRKESIRTMVTFCRETNQSPEAIKVRVKGFLDHNPKFSDRLMAMSEGAESIDAVVEVIKLIEGYDDVEHLYWETRRLLGERLRADWLALSLYSILYRERTVSKNTQSRYQELLSAIEQSLPSEAAAVDFLVGFFDCAFSLDKILNEVISEAVLSKFMDGLYGHSQILCLQVLEGIPVPEDVKILLRGTIATKQMEGLLNECKHKHGLS